MAAKILLFLCLSLAALAMVTLWRAGRNEARAEAAFAPQGRLLDVDGVQIHAVVMGHGPDLVLIHGASGNARDMTFSLAPLLARSYRVIVFDRPGLGYSQRLPRTATGIVQQADLLVRAAAQLGAPKPVVLGHSYGGAVALAWAVHHPGALSALVPVAAPSQPWTTPLDPFYRLTSSRLGSALVVPLITAFAPRSLVARAVDGIFAPQPVPEGYLDHVGAGLTLRRESLRANADQMANLLDEITALHPRLGEIAVPTEIVHGDADTTVGLAIHSEKLVKTVPGAVLTRLGGIGHMPHHVTQDKVVAAIDRAAERAGLR